VPCLVLVVHLLAQKHGDSFVIVPYRRRKRVSIAEALLSASPLQCWDNSTRGLDAANAVEFCEIILFLLLVLLPVAHCQFLCH
jgi:ATP-binding cassette subfamily G (WHITE) protein 2 (PDR)